MSFWASLFLCQWKITVYTDYPVCMGGCGHHPLQILSNAIGLSFHFDLPHVDLTKTDLPENMFFSSSPFTVTLFPHCTRKPMSHLSLISLWKIALLQKTSKTQNKEFQILELVLRMTVAFYNSDSFLFSAFNKIK